MDFFGLDLPVTEGAVFSAGQAPHECHPCGRCGCKCDTQCPVDENLACLCNEQMCEYGMDTPHVADGVALLKRTTRKKADPIGDPRYVVCAACMEATNGRLAASDLSLVWAEGSPRVKIDA